MSTNDGPLNSSDQQKGELPFAESEVCSVIDCLNSRSTPGITFWNPPSNQSDLAKWRQLLRQNSLSSSSKICSNHFVPDDFDQGRLRPEAVPSLFLAEPSVAVESSDELNTTLEGSEKRDCEKNTAEKLAEDQTESRKRKVSQDGQEEVSKAVHKYRKQESHRQDEPEHAFLKALSYDAFGHKANRGTRKKINSEMSSISNRSPSDKSASIQIEAPIARIATESKLSAQLNDGAQTVSSSSPAEKTTVVDLNESTTKSPEITLPGDQETDRLKTEDKQTHLSNQPNDPLVIPPSKNSSIPASDDATSPKATKEPSSEKVVSSRVKRINSGKGSSDRPKILHAPMPYSVGFPTCAVKNCFNHGAMRSKRFFRVSRGEKRRAEWESALGEKFSAAARVCSDHFDPSSILWNGQLHSLACPTRNKTWAENWQATPTDALKKAYPGTQEKTAADTQKLTTTGTRNNRFYQRFPTAALNKTSTGTKQGRKETPKEPSISEKFAPLYCQVHHCFNYKGMKSIRFFSPEDADKGWWEFSLGQTLPAIGLICSDHFDPSEILWNGKLRPSACPTRHKKKPTPTEKESPGQERATSPPPEKSRSRSPDELSTSEAVPWNEVITESMSSQSTIRTFSLPPVLRYSSLTPNSTEQEKEKESGCEDIPTIPLGTSHPLRADAPKPMKEVIEMDLVENDSHAAGDRHPLRKMTSNTPKMFHADGKVVAFCSVKGCSNHDAMKGIRMYKAPRDNCYKTPKRLWEKVLGQKLAPFGNVCSAHFPQSSIKVDGYLRAYALPNHRAKVVAAEVKKPSENSDQPVIEDENDCDLVSSGHVRKIQDIRYFPPHCQVENCWNHGGMADVRFYRVPREEKLRAKWEDCLKQRLSASVVCSDHFHPRSIASDGYLRNHACPISRAKVVATEVEKPSEISHQPVAEVIEDENDCDLDSSASVREIQNIKEYMPPHCRVENCVNHGGMTDVRFYVVPREENLRAKWEDCLKQSLAGLGSVVCSDHFDSSSSLTISSFGNAPPPGYPTLNPRKKRQEDVIMKPCCVESCRNGPKTPGVRMFHLPEDKDDLYAWQLLLDNQELQSTDAICSAHFMPDHFDDIGGLLPGACPILDLGVEEPIPPIEWDMDALQNNGGEEEWRFSIDKDHSYHRGSQRPRCGAAQQEVTID